MFAYCTHFLQVRSRKLQSVRFAGHTPSTSPDGAGIPIVKYPKIQGVHRRAYGAFESHGVHSPQLRLKVDGLFIHHLFVL